MVFALPVYLIGSRGTFNSAVQDGLTHWHHTVYEDLSNICLCAASSLEYTKHFFHVAEASFISLLSCALFSATFNF